MTQHLLANIGYCRGPSLPTILRWAGGKTRMAKLLCRLIPPHRVYVEPFAGGAALFFAKKPSPIEVLSDIDCRLIEFYRTVRELDSLDELLKFGWLPSRERFEGLKPCVTEGKCPLDDPLFRAYAFLYVNKFAYGAKMGRPDYNPRRRRDCPKGRLCGVERVYKVTILADTCERADEIDVERAQAAMRRAEERLKMRTADIDLERALAALRRAQVRLKVAQRRRARKPPAGEGQAT